MAESGGSFRYRAFLSYAHRDTKFCNRLHRRLETYRVPPRLVGRDSRDGPVPRRLAPIFRDREELPTSADLGDMLLQALADSLYLIVICSPHSARSRWVNEEILSFKRMGRSNRVLAIMIDGEPNASADPATADQECFPEALRFHVAPDGTLTDEPAEPIAADARVVGDGPRDATLKLVAGLLGVGFDELKQRELQRRQRRMLITSVASISLALVMIALATLAWIARNEAETQRGIAVERRVESEQRLSNQYVERGWSEYKRGDPPSAYMRFAEALRAQPGDADDEFVHRVRLGWLENRLPRIRHATAVEQLANVAISADRRWVADARTYGPARLIQVDDGRVTEIGDPSDPPHYVAFARLDQVLFMVHEERLTRWTLDGTLTHEWPLYADMARAADDFTSRVFLADNGFGTIVTGRGSRLHVIDGNAAEPEPRAISVDVAGTLRIDPTGRYLAITDDSSTIHDLDRDATIARLSHEEAWSRVDPRRRIPNPDLAAITRVVFSDNGRRFATADGDGLVQVWDPATGRPLGPPMLHPNAEILSLAIERDSTSLLTGVDVGDTGAVHQWNFETGEYVRQAQAHYRPVTQLVLDNDARVLAGLSAFLELDGVGTISSRITPITPPTHIGLRTYDRSVLLISYLPLRRSFSSLVQLWDLPAAPGPDRQIIHDQDIGAIATHPASSIVATITLSGELQTFDVESGRRLARVQLDEQGQYDLWLIGDVVWVTDYDGPLMRYDATTLDPIGEPFDTGGVFEMRLSRDGTRIAAIAGAYTTDQMRLSIWTSDGEFLRHIEPLDSAARRVPIDAFDWNHDGTLIVAAAGDHTIRIFDAETGDQRSSPMSIDQAITVVACAPNDDRIVIGLIDDMARVMTLDGTVACVTTPEVGSYVNQVTFGQNGDMILTASAHGTARLWSAETGEPLAPQMRQGPTESHADLAANARLILTRNATGTRLWDARSGAAINDEYPNQYGMRASLALEDRRLVTARGNLLLIWSIEPDPRPVSAIVDDARQISSRRLDETGGESLLSAEELLDLLDIKAP